MKNFIIVFSLLFSSFAMANHREIKVVSFHTTENGAFQNNALQLCARVIGGSYPSDRISIITDPGRRSESHYNTFPSTDGKFCQVVHSFSRRAHIVLWSWDEHKGKQISTKLEWEAE